MRKQVNLYLFVVQAEADGIDALERYRGKCEPTFLFYGVSVYLLYVVCVCKFAQYICVHDICQHTRTIKPVCFTFLSFTYL